MLRTSLSGVVLLALAGLPLAAQAPRVTPSGDPSVKADTIYRLAVDPSAYPEESQVTLLDDGIVRVESDGRVTSTYRQIVQLLTDEAVEAYNERLYSWAPETEKFRLNWIRVLRPDGTVISNGPTQQRESDVPISLENPVYSARKELRLSMSGVAKGTIVDWSYTTEGTKVWIPGDFFTSWSVHNAVPVRRSRFILDYPKGMPIHIQERNLTFQPTRVTSGNRVTVTYATADLPHIKPQRFATDTGPRFMSMAFAGSDSWSAIGAWYRGLAADRTTLGPVSLGIVQAKVAGAHTLIDSIRAVHKYIAQDIRYVSISLGRGGYQPRTPDEVVRTGFGDCKDKATFFVAAMRAFGLPAQTILINSSGGTEPDLPSINAFDHAIARVDLATGPVYVDLTADEVPFGELPPSLEGQLGVAVGTTGPIDTVRMPLMAIDSNQAITRITGTIDTAGKVRGDLVIERAGASAFELRGNYQAPLDSTKRDHLGRNVVQGIFPGGVCDTLELFNGKDLAAKPRLRFGFHDGTILRHSGAHWILPNPLGTMEEVDQTADAVEREGERWAAIDIAAVQGLEVTDNEVDLRFPAGWRPVLPPDVHVSGDFGTYDATYTFADGVLKARRVMHGKRGALPASRGKDLVAYLRAIAADNSPYITIENGSH